jgi:squalene cyclase
VNHWKTTLKADPTGWLLELENAPIRYWTLVDLLDRSPDDPEVRAAREAIPAYPPVAALLEAQKPEGYWVKPDYYLPRASLGTFWVLTVLADLGLTSDNEHVRRACEFMFTHQHENGAFNRRRRISGQGVVWGEHPEPCTHARIVRFLIQFGYGDDPRLRRAIDWLIPIQRDDGMWFCREEGRRGCLRATLDVLRIAALDPQTAARPEIPRAVEVVRDLLMEPRMSRYHIGENWGAWERLKYPYFGFSLLSALDALARLGSKPEEPRIAAALEYLLGRQLPDGSWPLDEAWSQPPIDFGRPGEPNKWITLDALRVIKLLYS